MNKEIIKKLLESFTGNLATLLMNLIFPLLVTRIYGEAILGAYTYNLSLITIALYLASLGLTSGMMYFIPRTGKKYILSAFLISLSFSTLFAGVWILLIDSLSLKLMLPLLVFNTMEIMFFSLYRVNQQIKEYFFTNIVVNNGVKVLLAYLFALYFEPRIECLILATYIGFILATIVYFIKQKNMFEGFYFHIEVLKYSIPLTIGTIMMFVMTQVDKIMIGNYLDKTAVAIYSVPSYLANFPSIFLLTLNTIFPPIISKLYHEKRYIRLKEIYYKSVISLISISSLTVIVIVLFSNQLLGLYGEAYLHGRWVLIMASIGQLFNAGVGSVWYIVSMTGNPKQSLIGKSIALIVNLILNFILIPKFGINGAAFATMVSIACNNLIGYYFVRKILQDSIATITD